MTEAELLGLIRRVVGISQQHDEQANTAGQRDR